MASMAAKLCFCALFVATAAPAMCFVPLKVGLHVQSRSVTRQSSSGHAPLRSRASARPGGPALASVRLVGPSVRRDRRGTMAMSASSNAPFPADPAALQKSLWEAVDVLPDMSETALTLEKTQDTGVSDLGFVASDGISKGQVIISVPMRYALVVNLKSNAKGDERPSDVRLALQLLRVLDLTDAGETDFDDDVKAFWRAYTLRILPRETFAAIAWEEADIEQLQYERTVEEVKALRSRLEELCKQTLEEEEVVDYDEDEESPPPGKRKVTISRMQAVRLPGGKTMMEDATLRWALSIVRSRSFMLDENDDSPVARRAIVPVADLFNHQPEGPLAWTDMEEELANPWQVLRGDDGLLYVDITAHRDYTKGEEVLLPYGLETSADLLCSHGIVLAENQADFVPVYSDAVELVGDIVELELEQDTAVAQAKLNLIQQADAAEAPLAIRPGAVGCSGHLLSCLQVAYAAPGELDQFEDAYDAAVGHFTLQATGLSSKRAAELRARAVSKAMALCDEELSRMPSSLGDDDAALHALKAEGSIDESTPDLLRAKLALLYRVGVKRILTQFRAHAAADSA